MAGREASIEALTWCSQPCDGSVQSVRVISDGIKPLVPLARLERARLATNDFESFASTIPPQGHGIGAGGLAVLERVGKHRLPLTKRARDQLVEPGMQGIISREDLRSADRIRPPAIIGDKTARFTHQ